MVVCSTFLIIKDKFGSIEFACFNKFSHFPKIITDKPLDLKLFPEKILSSLSVVVS